MKAAFVTGPNTLEIREVPDPVPGDRDIVVKMRACGICGSDTSYYVMGALPGYPAMPGGLPIGHEPTGVVSAVGKDVTGLAEGDAVFINPMAAPSGVIGNGGRLGALAEYLLVEDCEVGVSVKKIRDDIPFEVTALNEPMAVALHAVNRGEPLPTDKVVIFGAGPIGLGALIWLKLRGVDHVVVADVQQDRLDLAKRMGADAVLDSSGSPEEVTAQLMELHGSAANGIGLPRAGTDLYIDVAGAQASFDAIVASAKTRARVSTAGVYKHALSLDMSMALMAELDLRWAMGYPTEIFDVTDQLAEHWEQFAPMISHRIPFADLQKGFDLLTTPSGAVKVSILFD